MPNTFPPRNVIYYNDNTNPLSDIANTAYTDVIIGFLVPATNPDGSWLMNSGGGDGSPGTPGIALQNPPDPNGTLVSDIQKLHSAGKNVLISVGGAAGWFNPNLKQPNAYKLCAVSGGAEALAIQIVTIVKYYGFDGVDIDYEDNSGFTGDYDGVQFLVDLTNNLYARLPAGPAGSVIITHAPQTGYWDGSGNVYPWTSAPYLAVWQKVGSQITWFNNQFYNQGTTDDNIEALYPQIVNMGVKPGKMLVGTLLSAMGSADGYIGLDAMKNVLSGLTAKYLLFFGGAMGWEFSLDTPNGAWGSGIAQALGLPGGGFITPPPPGPTSGGWSVNDLTAATGAPAAAGDPNGFTFTANGTSGMHVVYRGVDNDIHELYWQNGAWGVNDLTAATGAPAAAGDPNGFAFTANGTSGMHVVYRGDDNDIHELYWQDGAWGVNDLTAATGGAGGDRQRSERVHIHREWDERDARRLSRRRQ